MKNIKFRLIELLKSGYCTPRIVDLAKKLKEPSTTIHYNIKQLEKEMIIGYKAVFNHRKIDQGFLSFVSLTIEKEEFRDPDKIAKELAAYSQVESVDVVTGEWDIIIRVRAKDIDEYYQFVKNVLSRKGIGRIVGTPSQHQIKSEFITIKD